MQESKYNSFLKILEEHAVPKKEVYHYTNWHGLKNILESKQLWLTDYRHLNDTSEIRYAIESILCLNSLIQKYDILRILKEEFFFKVLNIFTCSFCTEPNYLYAWRAYAEDGAGFSIGFKKEFFIADSTLEQPNPPNVSRTKIFYKNELEPYLNDFIQTVDTDLKNARDDSERNSYSQQFYATLLPFLCSIKHKAYQGEEEHRIYSVAHQEEANQLFYTYGETPAISHLNAKKRMYFTFDIKYISEIWVGPRLNFEAAKHDIGLLLEKLGIDLNDIHICPSKIPYKK